MGDVGDLIMEGVVVQPTLAHAERAIIAWPVEECRVA